MLEVLIEVVQLLLSFYQDRLLSKLSFQLSFEMKAEIRDKNTDGSFFYVLIKWIIHNVKMAFGTTKCVKSQTPFAHFCKHVCLLPVCYACTHSRKKIISTKFHVTHVTLH